MMFLWRVVQILLLYSLFSTGKAASCSGYTDVWGNWIEGFSCPQFWDWWDEIHCCGTSSSKYCCTYSAWLSDGFSDYSYNSEDYGGNTNPPGGSDSYTTTGWQIVVGIIGALFGTIILAAMMALTLYCVGDKNGNGQEQHSRRDRNRVSPFNPQMDMSVMPYDTMPPPASNFPVLNPPPYSPPMYPQTPPPPYSPSETVTTSHI